MRLRLYCSLLVIAFASEAVAQKDDPNTLARDLLLAVRYERNTDSLRDVLESVAFDDLADQLDSDPKKNAFWVNIYNAWYQILATEFKLENPDIFKAREIRIGGHEFNLDEIEHGILRRYRHKYALGYLPQLFVKDEIRRLAVSQVDWRIHFALNCGAISCPPIAVYEVEKLEAQFDLATRSFLRQEVKIDEAEKTIVTTRIMFWFPGDFGGKEGIREILEEVFQKDLHGYQIGYADYDWTPKLGYYKTD